VTSELWVEDLPGGMPPELVATPDEVATLTRPQREARVRGLVEHAHHLLDLGIERMVGDAHRVAAIVGLWSGGNDSTTLAHLMRDRVSHYAHANTGVGIEATRQFVRDTAAAWGVPLIERAPIDRDSYRTHVLRYGFPGPAMHFKMYTRLKERQLEQVRNLLVANPRRERVVFLAGRRRSESRRRAAVPEFDRKGSTVWVSPLVLWTKLDLNTYRLMHDVPVNPVTELLHMSGECLCGAFAAKGELDEVRLWFPDVAAWLDDLGNEARANGVDEQQCQWGWGAYRADATRAKAEARTGRLCGSCADRAQLEFDLEGSVAGG
jgi:3'-phosphoadenosine 5'-phosphosulfate sulfotransferase (PAPS reductase)/FAD synthetase